jgi:hypothetical protein
MAVALPLVAVSLTGAATDPTVTYHGVFDRGDLEGTCTLLFPGDDWSGVWNLQLRAPSGSPLNVKVTLKYEGRPHAVWRLPFTNVAPGSGAVVKGEWKPMPGMDEAMVVLAKDGAFTYQLTLNFPDDDATTEVDEAFYCDAHFTGHLTN